MWTKKVGGSGPQGPPGSGTGSTHAPVGLEAGGIYLDSLAGNIKLKPHPLANNPVITPAMVTDTQADFVADPFIVRENGLYYCFFEVYETSSKKGRHAYATSKDGLTWTYGKLVFVDSQHLSYPQVFKYNGVWYMLPERGGGSNVGLTLYRATNFPEGWVVDTVLMPTGYYSDPIPLYWQGKWYIFTYNLNSTMDLYYADSIKSTTWTKHPMSPVISGLHVRGGGRPIVYKDAIDLILQGMETSRYGEKLQTYRVSKLTSTEFEYIVYDNRLLFATGLSGGVKQWNSDGMHQADILFTDGNTMPIVVVDGLGSGAAGSDPFSIGIYTVDDETVPYIAQANGSAAAIPNNAWTIVPFSSTQTDSNRNYNSTTYAYTIPAPGFYYVSGHVILDVAGTVPFAVNIKIDLNGVEVCSNPTQISVVGRHTMKAQDVMFLKKDDVVKIFIHQASGTSQNILGGAGLAKFSIFKVVDKLS